MWKAILFVLAVAAVGFVVVVSRGDVDVKVTDQGKANAAAAQQTMKDNAQKALKHMKQEVHEATAPTSP